MNRILWIYLLLIISIQVFSQTDLILRIPDNSLSWYEPIENTDSLKKILTKANYQDKVNILCEISYALLKNQPIESYDYAKQSLNLADSIGYNNGRVMALYLLSSDNMPGKYDLIRSRKLLQKAESLMDEATHWTLKYRIWFGIGGLYKNADQVDSAMYYFNKPLIELDGEQYWYSHLGSYGWLAQYAKLNHQYKKEREYVEKYFDLILRHFEYHKFTDEKVLLGSLEKLSAFYTQHGEYKLSVAINHRVLDSIFVWSISPATRKVYIAKYLGKIGRAYHHWGKYDSAIRYHDSSLYYFKKVYNENLTELNNNTYPSMAEWSINYANQLEERAGVQMKIGDLSNVEADLFQSVQLRTDNNDILGVAMSLDKLGEFYALKGMFALAVLYYDSALIMKLEYLDRYNSDYNELSRAFGNDMINESISYTYLKIGQLYDAWHKQNLSIGYYNKSLVLSRKIDYQKGEAEVLTNLGDIYLTMNKPDSALLCYEYARNIYQIMENRPGLAMVYENMGNYYINRNKLLDARNKFMQAKILYEYLEMPADHARVLSKLGDINLQKNEFSEAIKKYEAGLLIAERLDLKKLLVEFHKSLSEIYDRQNDIEKAYFHYKAYTLVSNAIFTLETNKQIAEIETKFETEKKEQQIILLQEKSELQRSRNQQTILIVVIILAFIIMILIVLSLYLRQNRLKVVQERTVFQQKLLRSQMNPHFIFNSLASIQNAIINEEPHKASKYLARFSKLVRNILDSSVAEFIPLEEEITTIENYLELQKIRFPEKFDYSIEVDEKLDIESIHVPPMLAQPFIENSIEHGIKHRESKGTIIVRFLTKESKIMIEVEDNGIGREKAQEKLIELNNNHKSMATVITQDRIRILNKNLKSKISMKILDLKNDLNEAIGTKVIFEI